MMMPPLNIDREVAAWFGVGFVVMLCGLGLYLAGVSEGGRAMKQQCDRELAKVTLELSDTKTRLDQARADLVGAAAQGAADQVIDCQHICAQEVEAALNATHDLLCGEVK